LAAVGSVIKVLWQQLAAEVDGLSAWLPSWLIRLWPSRSDKIK